MIARNFNEMSWRALPVAGQKAQLAGQALPGVDPYAGRHAASGASAVEAVACL